MGNLQYTFFNMTRSDWLLLGGIVAMAATVIVTIILLLRLHFRKKKLDQQMDQEYGPRVEL